MPWIENLFSLLGQSWVGTALSIIAIPLAIVTYILSRRRTKMAYVHLGEHLLGSDSDSLPSEIVVQYRDISIPRLTRSVLIIWNNGENTLSGTDIVEKDPLRLAVGMDGRILSVSVLKTSRPVNDFRVISPPAFWTNEAPLSFDFLDKNDGAVIEVLHTSSNRTPSLLGTMRGLPQGFSSLGHFSRPKPQKQKKKPSGPLGIITTVIFSPPVLALAGFALALYGPRPEFLAEVKGSGSFINGLMGGLGGFFAMWVITTWSSRRKYPRNLHPESLD